MPLPNFIVLILAGGMSSRMGQDKSTIQYHGKTIIDTRIRLLNKNKIAWKISCRLEQKHLIKKYKKQCLVDSEDSLGPAEGLFQGWGKYPQSAFFIWACDMPNSAFDLLLKLISLRSREYNSLTYQSSTGIEPLFALYEPAFKYYFYHSLASGQNSLRKMLEYNKHTFQIDLPKDQSLKNYNTKSDLDEGYVI